VNGKAKRFVADCIKFLGLWLLMIGGALLLINWTMGGSV